jgi:hypothetical protein
VWCVDAEELIWGKCEWEPFWPVRAGLDERRDEAELEAELFFWPFFFLTNYCIAIGLIRGVIVQPRWLENVVLSRLRALYYSRL